MTSEQQIFNKLQRYAKKNGFRLNPNKEVVDIIIKKLMQRKNQFGEYYCPCRRVTGNTSIDEKNICPCISCKEEVGKNGHCHCFLFVK